MKKINFSKAALIIVLGLTLGSCKKNAGNSSADQWNKVNQEMMTENGANPDEASVTENSGATNNAINKPGENGHGNHYLYTESNNSGQNTILIYEQKANGSLHPDGTIASGGAGTGKALGSQGALVLDRNHQWLFAVNAGSNSVSSFKVHDDGSLTLAHTESTMGTTPVSLCVYDNFLYVLNRGSDEIHGFRIGAGGALSHIAGSSQSLSGTAVDAPQISFTPNGNWVVVTEKATNTISAFKVKNDGSVGPGIFSAAVGATPFGFSFSRGRFMIVSNAAGGAAGAGSATSYVTAFNGKTKDINGAIPNSQAAPCWVSVTKYGRFAYVSNTGSNNISSYYVAPWGGLYLVQAAAAKTDMAPADNVVAANNYYLYVLTAKSNTIGEYHRKFLGGLEFIGSVSGIPASATGLAIF